MIPVYKPFLNKKNMSYAHDAIDSTWISSQGEYLDKSERLLSDFYSDKRALLCNNGTSSLHILARCVRKYHPNIKKIIVPNNVYVAAWNTFLFDKEYELEAVDADINTWNYDLDKLYNILNEQDLGSIALLVVHNLGNIVNVPKIKKDWPGLLVVEDNCEGFGGGYVSESLVPSGSCSTFSAISFFGNKNITSGEGGALILNSDDEYNYACMLRGQGQSKKRFIHEDIGYNYRMTNIQAAILYGQLLMYSEIMSSKESLFKYYQNKLSDIDEVKIQQIENDTKHSNWMLGIRIEGSNYDDAERYFNKNQIEVRPMFYPMTQHAHLRSIKQNGLSVAERLNRECVILPSYPELKISEVDLIIQVLKGYISGVK